MGAVQTVAPTLEPLTIAETKLHLRVDGTADDTLIASLIATAREHAEAYLRRSLITQTWRLDLDEFADSMPLPHPPISSITKIDYTDTDGNTQTLATTVYELDSYGSCVRLQYGESWPSTRDHKDVVQITYVTGYGASGADVPDSIKSGMLMLIGHWYENREISAPLTIFNVPYALHHLWSPYKWATF